MNTPHRSLWAVLAVTAVLYLPALSGEWLNWDDNKLFDDPILAMPALEAVGTAFSTQYDRAWYPLLRLVFRGLDGWGVMTPATVHTLDLALFLAIGAGIGWWLTRLGLQPRAAAIAVALWALHPLRVESVAWASATKDVLSLALVVGAALLAWPAGDDSVPRRVGAHLAWLAALLVKSAIFPIAGVLWLVAWAREGAAGATRRFGGFIVLSLVDAAIAAGAFRAGEVPPWPDQSLLLAPYSHGSWLLRTLWPAGLAAVHPLPPDLRPMAVFATVVGITATAVAVWRWRRHEDRWPLVLVGAWVLPMLPVSGLVPLQFWAADRYPLVAHLALAVPLGVALDRSASYHRALPWAMAGALCAGLSFATIQRVGAWHDSLSLWTADAQRPGHHFARHVNLGSALGGVGRFAEAVAEYRKAEALAPDRVDILAHRLFAELVVGGWDHRRSIAGSLLEPPPRTAEQWAAAAEGLMLVGEPDLSREAAAVARRLASGGGATPR